jgi:hypothetical protein
MTVDVTFAKLDVLLEDWVNGRINPLQRSKTVAWQYKIDLRMYEEGYPDGLGGPPDNWKRTAEKLLQFERAIGSDILRFA